VAPSYLPYLAMPSMVQGTPYGSVPKGEAKIPLVPLTLYLESSS
jgi:hypothetical protein